MFLNFDSKEEEHDYHLKIEQSDFKSIILNSNSQRFYNLDPQNYIIEVFRPSSKCVFLHFPL